MEVVAGRGSQSARMRARPCDRSGPRFWPFAASCLSWPSAFRAVGDRLRSASGPLGAAREGNRSPARGSASTPPPRGDRMISVCDLQKRYGPTLAVDRISFDVQKGEVVGFLGPNGAGKTTTIRVLTCFHPANGGSATVGGFDVRTDPLAVRRQIGSLPETVPMYTDQRVEEDLRYRAALKGVPRRERSSAVERAMEKAGVLEVRRKLVGHVSRGYRQRTGLADAMVANPPILILDEPTSGLDPNQRRRIKDLVRELAQEHTILFSSHILAEVQDVSSRILVIHRGRLRADGVPSELVASTGRRTLRVEARAEPKALTAALAPVPGLAAAECSDRGE